MKTEIDPNAQIFIIEGIPGAGKTTFHNLLKEKLQHKVVYDFHEEDLLFSWKHAWLPNIHQLRFDLYNTMLDYCEKTLKVNKDAVFIFNRFHISLYLFSVRKNEKMMKAYKQLIKRLEKFNVHIYVPILSIQQIEERSSHQERKEKVWPLHLQKRLEWYRVSSLTEMYSKEQDLIKSILKEQKFPHSLVSVDAPQP